MFSRRISSILWKPNEHHLRVPAVILTTVKVEGVNWVRGNREIERVRISKKK
jgi:hypothetical protein